MSIACRRHARMRTPTTSGARAAPFIDHSGTWLAPVSDHPRSTFGSSWDHLGVRQGRSLWTIAPVVQEGWLLTRFQTPPDGICARPSRLSSPMESVAARKREGGTGSVRPAVDSYDLAWDR